MNFKECKISGQLVAQGDKGQYWIEDLGWAYLKSIEIGINGPIVEDLDTYNSVEEAKQAAEAYDKAEE